MKKKYSLATSVQFNKLLMMFVAEFGLPQIRRNFSVYAFNQKKDEFHISYIDQRCDIKLIPTKINKGKTTPPIFIENNNLKRLFETVWRLGFKSANIGLVFSLNFSLGNDVYVSFLNKTFADNVIELKFGEECAVAEKAKTLFDNAGLKLIDNFDLKKFLKKKTFVEEDLFDKFGCLNAKILKFGEMTGIDVMSEARTIRSRVKKFSNDYSIYEEWFQKITGSDVCGVGGLIKKNLSFKPVSIIIPCYNTEETIVKTLFSIESQDIIDELKKQIEVVLVDDGSVLPVSNIILPYLEKFTFKTRIVRLEANSGLSTARNVGIFSSKNDLLILLDSDVLIPKNYVMEHVVRNQLIPHAVFVSLKKNIDNSKATIEKIKQGLKSPRSIDDLRISKEINKDQKGVYSSPESTTIEILNDTNYFKQFGHGRVVGLFDLSTMVIGHNMSLRRKTIDKAGYFSSNFTGWGLEDSYFGSRLIANGNYVIPVLSSNVFHINHPPRSGSEEAKQREFMQNLELYNFLLEKENL